MARANFKRFLCPHCLYQTVQWRTACEKRKYSSMSPSKYFDNTMARMDGWMPSDPNMSSEAPLWVKRKALNFSEMPWSLVSPYKITNKELKIKITNKELKIKITNKELKIWMTHSKEITWTNGWRMRKRELRALGPQEGFWPLNCLLFQFVQIEFQISIPEPIE